jgi:phospho-N-acetylmuramoyl-pentapeptide-transferase
MGGLLILLSVVGSTLLWAPPLDRFILLLLWVTVTMAGVGIYDDYMKLKKRKGDGASSRVKFAIQGIAAVGVVAYLAAWPPNPHFATSLLVPYTKQLLIPLGSMYFTLAILIIIGSSNAVNLTDGLDGLAAGNLIFCALTFAVFAYVAGHARFAEYLKVVPVPGAGEISVFLAAVAGACLGFLWFNAYPAEVFMGDTSSLFLGGVMGTVAVCIRQELLLPIVGGIFVLETMSVILQMGSYKLRKGKRIFLMAPIHHHFELKGWAEPKVTVRFWIIGILLAMVSLASLKIR